MINILPDEIICVIASFLSFRGLNRLSKVNRKLHELVMEDEDSLDVLWAPIAQSINENYFWMFGAVSNHCPIQVTSDQCKLIEKIDDVDDDDILINSPLKSSSVLKFRKNIQNFRGKMIKITPRALLSKSAYLIGSDNGFGAAKIDRSVIKTMADLVTSSSITLSLWFKIDDICNGGVLFGVQNQDFSSGSAFVPVIYLTYSLALRATFWGARALVYSDLKSNGKWQHVALTKHKNEQKLYVNGIMVDSSTSNQFTHHEHRLYYGQLGSGLCDRWPGADMNYRTNCYTLSGGKISDVCILNKALDATELKQLMINPHSSNSIAHFDFIQDKKVTIVGDCISIGTDFEGFIKNE